MSTVLSCHGRGRLGCRSLSRTTARVAAVLLLLPGSAMAGEAFRFEAQTRTLTVNTGRVELTILGGAAVAIRDLQAGDVFSPDANWADLAKASTGAI